MNKVKAISYIVGAVVFSYVILLLVWAALTAITASTAASVAARPGIEQYTGAVEGLNYTPLVLFAAPAVIGIICVVIVLRKKS